MNWEIFTALSIFSRSLYSIASRNFSVKVNVSPIVLTFLISLFSSVLILLVSPFLGGIKISNLFALSVPFGLLIGTSIVGNILYFSGQKNLDTGTTQVAFSSILVWGIVLSHFILDSQLSIIQIVGSVLLLIAILLTQWHSKEIKLINKPVALIIASTFMFSLFQVLSADLSQKVSAGTYLFVGNFGVALVLLLLNYQKIWTELGKLFLIKKQVLPSTTFASVTSLLYFVFSYAAYRVAPDPGLVVILLTSQVVFSVVLGIILLGERTNLRRKLFAAFLALIAAILIKS